MCDTDHSLVCSNIRIEPKKLHRSKKPGEPRLHVSSSAIPEKKEQYIQKLEVSLLTNDYGNATDEWNNIREAIYESAKVTLGEKNEKSQAWFEANIDLMEPLIQAKRMALSSYGTEAHLQKLMDKLSHACKTFGLTLSIKKIKILAQGVTGPNKSIKIDGNELENVNKLNYLGSTISSSLSLTDEINARTGKAAADYSKLEESLEKPKSHHQYENASL